MSLYKRATSADSKPALTDAERKELSERSVAFADLHCDAAAAEQASAAHAALTRQLAPKADAKKRTADDAAGSQLRSLAWHLSCFCMSTAVSLSQNVQRLDCGKNCAGS